MRKKGEEVEKEDEEEEEEEVDEEAEGEEEVLRHLIVDIIHGA